MRPAAMMATHGGYGAPAVNEAGEPDFRAASAAALKACAPARRPIGLFYHSIYHGRDSPEMHAYLRLPRLIARLLAPPLAGSFACIPFEPSRERPFSRFDWLSVSLKHASYWSPKLF